MRKRPTCVGPATMPRISGTSVVRSEMTPVATLDWSTNDRMPGTSSASSREAPAESAGARPTPTTGDRDRGDRLRDHDRDQRLGHAERRGDHDGQQAEPARPGLVDAPQVVAAVEEERRRRNVLRGLDEREQRRHEEGLLDALRAEELVGERRERDEDHRRERSAGDLEAEHLAEEPPEPAPVLRGDVAKPVLRERLLDREVEKRLEEADRREGGREDAEVVEPEDARGDDRPGDAEDDGGVDPRSRRRPASEDAGGHRA